MELAIVVWGVLGVINLFALVGYDLSCKRPVFSGAGWWLLPFAVPVCVMIGPLGFLMTYQFAKK